MTRGLFIQEKKNKKTATSSIYVVNSHNKSKDVYQMISSKLPFNKYEMAT